MKSIFLPLLLACTLLYRPANAQVSITATGGTTGPTTYADFTGAFSAINAGTHTGAITVTVTASFSQSTTGVLNASGTGSASYTSVLIKPGAGTTPVITSSADNVAAIKLDGADNVTIDGSNNSTTTRDMTFQNSNSSGSGQAVNIWLASNSTNGATGNTIKNCRIMGSSYSLGAAYVGVGVLSTNTTLAGYWTTTSVTTGPNSNNLIQNNLFSSANAAIVFKGGAGIGETGNQIIGNVVGDVTSTAANKFTNVGIYLQNQANFLISKNTVTWMNASNANVQPGGISIGAGSSGTIANNNVNNIRFGSNASVSSLTTGGLVLNATTGVINVYNNFISDIASTGSATPATNAYGIAVLGGSGYNLGFNSVNMNTDPTSTATGYQAALYVASGVSNLDIRNNLFIHSGINTTNKFSIYSVSANPATSTINYNDYYTTSSTLGYAGANLTTLANVQASFQNGLTNLKNVLPVFVGTPDLHLVTTNTSNTTNLAGAGTPITGVTTDYDGTTRSSAPTLGAHELPASCPAPTNLAAGSITSGTASLTWTAASGASGYEYVLDQTAGNPSGAGTPIAASPYNATTLSPLTTYYFHLRTSCGGGLYSSWVTVSFTTLCTNPVAVINATAPLTRCAPDSVRMSAKTATATSYQWKKGGIDITGATDSVYYATTSGSYTVVTAISTCNTTSAAVVVTINPRPDTAVTMTPASGTICTGTAATFSVANTAGATYQWYKDGTAINTATNATYSATIAGQYRVRVTTGGGCTDTSVARTLTVVPAAVSSITYSGSPSFCAGSSIVLNGPATSGITYQWRLNGADISGATAQTYTATTGGSYRLIVSNGTCSDTSSVVAVSVNPVPGAGATAGGPLSFCQGGSVLLTASASATSGLSYQWLRGGLPIAGANNPTYSATLSGSYTVRIAINATGCADTSAPPITVNVSTIPATTLTVIGSLTFCQGSTVRFQAATVNGYTYQWFKDGTLIPGATTSSYTANAAGVYYAIITNGPCTTTTVSRTVVVNPLPTVATVANGPTAFCQGGSVVLDGGTTAGLAYQWRRNAVNIAGATSSTYTANQSGSYTLVVTNANGCQATSTPIVVTVSTQPVPQISASGPAIFCQGNSVTLTATLGAGYTYQWALNGTPIVGATGSSYGASVSGNYTVNITNGTCQAASSAFSVTVIPAPPAVITPASALTFCQGGSVTLNANRGSGYTYQWTLGGVDITGATNYQYTTGASGTYGVKISDGTCPAAAAPVTVTVNAFPAAVITLSGGVNMSTGSFSSYQWYRNGQLIPGATGQNYTATRDGFYAVVVSDAAGCSATSNVQQISGLAVDGVPGGSLQVSIYPNPASGLVQVRAGSAATDVTVLSVDGRVLMAARAVNSVDISALAQGVYLIRVADHASGQVIALQKLTKN